MSGLGTLEKKLREVAAGEVERGRILAPYTSYRIGGPAGLFVSPGNEEAVGRVLRELAATDVPLLLLGCGSNVLISDEGFDGVVLHIGANLSGWSFDGPRLFALAGSNLLDLIRDSVRRGLAGMELMAGIPGGVGGALRMNAGAFGQEIESVVRSVRGYTKQGEPLELSREQILFGYRSAPELQQMVICSAEFELAADDAATLHERLEDILELRAKKQPLEYPSCGSVFKRPPGYYAGALIEEVGMKGHRHGGAMVADKHAGFVLNVDDASARDIRELIEQIEAAVEQRFGVQLEREVKLYGFGEASDADS